jgi:aerobactin synthase
MTADTDDAERDRWRRAGAVLLRRLLAEFCYEQMLTPSPAVDGGHRLDFGAVSYLFGARRGPMGSWLPPDDRPVLRVTAAGAAPADDPCRFVLDAAAALGFDGGVCADVIRELAATQRADARLLASAPTAAALADASHVDVEGRLGGHPCIVANKGRLGFGVADADLYTPEARTPFRLRWAAVHPRLAATAVGAGCTLAALVEQELDPQTRAAFAAAAPPDWPWLPVHPWQWDNVVGPLFAGPIAEGSIVDLGEAPDRYLPLQSVRTLANVDRPDRHDVKLALTIRNTLVWRGLSPADALAGPAVSDWIIAVRDRDPFLRDVTGVLPQAERAGVAVAHPLLDDVDGAPYKLHELLGAIWRRPVRALLEPGERARALASLLLVGSDGRPLAAELVARSGLPPQRWLDRLFAALLPPVLHYLCGYGLAFTPHGENVTLVFDERDVPTRIAVKDFGADVELLAAPGGSALPEHADLPAVAVARLRRWPAADLAHTILSAICAGCLRHFSVLCADHLGVGQPEFWGMVRRQITGYAQAFPGYADRLAAFDLLGPAFPRVCLNREQLAGAAFHDRADRDGAFDLIHGAVDNPLHVP